MADLATCDYWINFYSDRKMKLEQARTKTVDAKNRIIVLGSDMNKHKTQINGLFGTQDWEGAQVQKTQEMYSKGITTVNTHGQTLMRRLDAIFKGELEAEGQIIYWQAERAAEEARLAAAAAAAAAMGI